ncbi:MAG: acyl-CoA dehydrogenase family protein [Mycobacteriales bacterium]
MRLSADERSLVEVVRDFVEAEVRPVVREWEHCGRYPTELIEHMKQIGLFGLLVPEPHGAGRVSAAAFAAVTAELARGWMSLAGAIGGHSVVCELLLRFGTPDQQARFLPEMASGNCRATMALTEPSGGSDLAALKTTAVFDGTSYLLSGAKVWITNARNSGLIAVLGRTDASAYPSHQGLSVLLVTPGPGLEVSRDLPKLGYRGVESCELRLDGYRLSPADLLGGEPGQGFAQMMRGLEIGRVQVAARALGVARAAFDDSLGYAQTREAFGKPIWQHQSIGNYLADMATKLAAAEQLINLAADVYDSGQRSDLEAGMAKLFASEAAMEIALMAMRIHGSYGYSTEFDVERYFRDAPLMIIGEGTNEIQRGVITRALIARSKPH